MLKHAVTRVQLGDAEEEVNFWRKCMSTFIHSFHSAVCLTSGPKPLPKPALHTVRSRASPFKWQYPLLLLKSSSSFLRLLPRLHITSMPPIIFPSIARCRRQFLLKMWPIKLAFRLFISCTISLCSLTLSNTSFLTRSVQLIFSSLPQHRISKLRSCLRSTARSVPVAAPYKTMLQMQQFASFFLNSKSNVPVKRALFLLNTALAIAILGLISPVHLPSFVKMLSKYLKDSTFSSCFFLVYHNFYWEWLSGISDYICFPPHSFPSHSIRQFQLVHQTCPEAPFLP